MSKIIRLVDRTRTVTDWKCPRARWWGYEYGGRGLSKASTNLALFTGIVTHDALAAIATFQQRGEAVPIDTIAELAFQQLYDNIIKSAGDMLISEAEEFAKEQATLTEGMLRGFYKHVWPLLMSAYPKIVAIEQEMEYELADGFIFMAKPDLIVEDTNGDLVYLEYKTTSSKKESWVNSWDTAVQLHSSVKATEATLGRTVAAVQIVGLYKGYETYGKQSSTFCYGYLKKGNPPFTQDQITYEYKTGFRRTPTWEMEGGVKAWIEAMPSEVLAAQFPLTPQIFINEELVEAFFRQRASREAAIADAKEWIVEHPDDEQEIMDVVYPQRFDQCVPSFGYSCEYRKLCHSGVKDPLSEGFTLRQPHHQREVDQLNEQS